MGANHVVKNWPLLFCTPENQPRADVNVIYFNYYVNGLQHIFHGLNALTGCTLKV
jgi:hypothetical protein